MANETVVYLFGEDEGFIRRFGAYLQQKAPLPLAVSCFTREEELRQSLKEKPAELLLVPEALREEFSGGRASLFYFTEDRGCRDPRALYLYRPMEKQLRQLLEDREDAGAAGDRERPATVWALFSPAGGCGRTAAALLLGQQLAESGPTLFLSTERFSGLSRQLAREKQGDLSELLYAALVRGKPAEKLPELTEHLGRLELVLPPEDPKDLRDPEEEDWLYLLTELRNAGRYRHIVLDLGDGIREESWLLRQADRILLPVRADRIAADKEQAWRAYLAEQGEEALAERARRLELPDTPEVKAYLDHRELRLTEWGRSVKQLLQEEDV